MSANTYIYTSVGPPGAVAQGVDDSGEVVGFYGNETGSGSGFTDIGGVFSTVVVSGATQTDVTAVADGGVIAGYLVLSGNNYPDAFVGEPGSLTIISAPSIDDPNAPYGGIGLDPSAVNAGGEVVGAAYSQGSFTYANGTYTPLVVSNSQQTVATGINDSGEVVGWYQAAGLNGEYGGFISTAAGLSTVNPFPFNAQFTAINNGGEIVGTAYPGNMGEAFTDTDGIVAILPQPPGISQVAVALNDAGTVVGYDENLGTLDSVAFIDLGGIVDTFAPAGAITTEPTGINNLGEVVGDYVDANEEAHAFTLTVTPSYTFATIALSGVQSVALNNQGEIVGTYADPTGQLHGFVDSGGAVSAFDDRGAVNTTVTAVNYGGAFTGFSSASDASGSQWFVDSAGTLTDIPSGSAPVQPVAIGFGGEVAGNDGTEGFYALSGGPTRAVAVPGAVTTKVTGLNNSEIVGDYTDSAGIQHGFTDIAGTIATIDPAGSVSTTIAGVNAGGELAGTYSNGVDTVGFTEANDVFTQLTLPGSTDAVATGLNDAGSVVGYATGSDGQDHGFLYDGGSMFAIDPAGSVDTQPTAINDEGEIAGVYTGTNGAEYGFSAVTIGDVATPACYCPGTLIRTIGGEQAVETLEIGDQVVTGDGTVQPVRWIGRRSYAARFLRARPALLPVRILAGALAKGIPHTDLLLSPEHAMVLDGLLVPAGALVNGTTIRREQSADRVDYIHIELAQHDVVWANGAAAETFVDDESRARFSNAAEYTALYPDAATPPAVFCADRVTDGYALDAIRARLGTRAGTLMDAA